MKRLIKLNDENIGINPNLPVEKEPSNFKEQPIGDMVSLDVLSEADVCHDRCPICDNENSRLIRSDGFKVCNSCGSQFKLLDGKAYVIV